MLAQAFVDGGQVVALDDNVSRWASGSVPSGLEWTARVFTWLGSLAGVAIVTGVATVVLWRAARRRDATLVVSAVVGITIAVAVLKAVYARARPDLGSAIALPHSYSFPSGHAATAVVVYGLLGMLLAERSRSRAHASVWLVVAAAVALAIGASRFVLNVHFLSDVLAGFALGLAWLGCCLIARDGAAIRGR